MSSVERRLAAANLVVAPVALFGGVVTGLVQALEYAGVEVYASLAPVIRSHYHSLSIHGVLNALVFTTFFICGFLPFIATRSLGRPLARPGLGWLTFWLMTAGVRFGRRGPARGAQARPEGPPLRRSLRRPSPCPP